MDRFGMQHYIKTSLTWEGMPLTDEDEDYQKKWSIRQFLCSCNGLRQCVSLKKKRMRDEGFDLDLTYITSNIIAMGYPADGIEGSYRNHKDQVSRYLKMKHYLQEDSPTMPIEAS